jgi:hypothetical protein
MADINELLEAWPPEQAKLRECLLELKACAESLPGAAPSFVSRPGISHSLRFDLDPRPNHRARPVFFLVDVVADGPEYFLSVCFYEDEISDPLEMGNAIPQGLFAETGYCFDVEEPDPDLQAYLNQRIKQAHRSALK